jgi:sodium/proline symporter
MDTTTIILITLIVYKVTLISIGLWASRRVKSESDYFLAGQNLGAWTAGLSYAASTSSAWVLLGFTGAVFTTGMTALWLVPGIFAGYLLTWLVIGPRLNAETRERGHITIVDFLSADAAEDGSPHLRRMIRIVSAAIILFCFIFYIASQFQAAGNALTEAFGLGLTESILIGAAVIVIYCFFGGFWAASITDALQAVVMLLACLIVPIVMITQLGGVSAVADQLHASPDHDWFHFDGGQAGLMGVGVAMGLLGTGLGALGQPQLLNRIMAVRSQRERIQGAMITLFWGTLIYTGLILLACAAKAVSLETGTESVIFAAARAYLPPALAGIVIAAVLSAVMSTVDSLLLASASAVSHDSDIPFSNPLLAGRLAMVGVAVLAVILTLTLQKDIFSRVLFAWVALGAAFGPTILTRAIGWRVKPIFILWAIMVGFVIAVTAYNIEGTLSDVIEKWGSWAIGLLILTLGKTHKEQM